LRTALALPEYKNSIQHEITMKNKKNSDNMTGNIRKTTIYHDQWKKQFKEKNIFIINEMLLKRIVKLYR